MLDVISRVNNVYPMKLDVKTPGLAVCMEISGGAEPTHQELVECLERVVGTATAKGGKGAEAKLMTWHATGSRIVQDGSGTSTDWRKQDGHHCHVK